MIDARLHTLPISFLCKSNATTKHARVNILCKIIRAITGNSLRCVSYFNTFQARNLKCLHLKGSITTWTCGKHYIFEVAVKTFLVGFATVQMKC